ncbi:DUF4397 domain-containing protein [Mucilaginibacter sp. PAMB04274]|uniref:DUF4397 domain-containing protein n=1 Tax=Mucilaginibacter sp. PAMB04274 TaxID=3138568 RepID=UPI0031F6F8F9
MIRRLYFIGALTVLTLVLAASCVKNDPVVPVQATVNVNVINAISDSVIVNYYLNGTRLSSLTGIFPLASSGNTLLPRGNQVITIKRLYNNRQIDAPDTLFTFPVRLDSIGSSQRYSLFLGGVSRNTAFKIIDTLESDPANAKLKFVVASPAAPALKVYLNDTLRFTTTTFKSVSKFIPVGNGKKEIKIFTTTGTDPLYKGTVILNVSNSYTLFSSGSGKGFRAGLLTNR